MIDSHTHLDSCTEPNEQLIDQARAAGLTRLLTVGTNAESCRAALAAAEQFDEVYAAIGRHPNEATGYDAAALDDLRQLAAHPKCVAIGETGLDQYRDDAPIADQRRAFADHIALAREFDKPLVIHTRAADQETINTLREQAQGVRVVLHCFSMPERVQECVAEGWWISFAGNVTYPANAALAQAATAVPADRLLVETDAPYLTPVPHRKQRNRPDLVVHTAGFVAEQRGLTDRELDALVTANATALFRW
ncbi:MAG: TatD family hydrolase [Patulibacter sp.]